MTTDKRLFACYPHPHFPAISVTGNECSFNCKHCNRRYLEGMISCSSPEQLLNTGVELARNGARGVLLSGGYSEGGYVPYERFLETIKRLKNETGLFISAHTGLAPEKLAKGLGRAGVDLADFDLIGNDATIKLVLNSDKKAGDYLRAMKSLKEFLPEVVPHICVGLHGGELKGEFKAVEMAAEANPRMLVLLVLNPTKGTPFENIDPPSTGDLVRVIDFAKEKLPKTELALGCMRPKNEKRGELEQAAFLAGVNRIAMPSPSTLKFAEESGATVRRLNACCSVPLDAIGETLED